MEGPSMHEDGLDGLDTNVSNTFDDQEDMIQLGIQFGELGSKSEESQTIWTVNCKICSICSKVPSVEVHVDKPDDGSTDTKTGTLMKNHTPRISMIPSLPAGSGLVAIRTARQETPRFGARVSRDYKSGPGKDQSVSPNCKYNTEVQTEQPEGFSTDEKETRRISIISNGTDVQTSPRGSASSVNSIGSNASSAASSRASSAASSRASSAASLSSVVSRGKKRLADMRGEAIFSAVPGSVEFDPDKYAGVIRVDFQPKGRLKLDNAVGVNVARTIENKEKEPVIVPGRVIRQTGKKGTYKYMVVYLDGSKNTLDEELLVYHSQVYCSASTRLENPIKPLIVEML